MDLGSYKYAASDTTGKIITKKSMKYYDNSQPSAVFANYSLETLINSAEPNTVLTANTRAKLSFLILL